MAKTRTAKVVETLKDDEATRRNIPPHMGQRTHKLVSRDPIRSVPSPTIRDIRLPSHRIKRSSSNEARSRLPSSTPRT